MYIIKSQYTTTSISIPEAVSACHPLITAEQEEVVETVQNPKLSFQTGTSSANIQCIACTTAI